MGYGLRAWGTVNGKYPDVFDDFSTDNPNGVNNMPVYRLEEDNIYFPLPELAEPDGLLAVGGDLSVERLILAYSNGIFPWYSKEDPILWWCPKERFIIRPKDIHVSHSLNKFMRKHDTEVVFDRDFADTIHRCRMRWENESGTWITDEMEEAYCKLHDSGYALSVESFVYGRLAGGLYGVILGKCFFGESMFSYSENGSKIALVKLAELLADNDFLMIDCQFHTAHLESMGGVKISYSEYCGLLEQGLTLSLY